MCPCALSRRRRRRSQRSMAGWLAGHASLFGGRVTFAQLRVGCQRDFARPGSDVGRPWKEEKSGNETGIRSVAAPSSPQTTPPSVDPDPPARIIPTAAAPVPVRPGHTATPHKEPATGKIAITPTAPVPTQRARTPDNHGPAHGRRYPHRRRRVGRCRAYRGGRRLGMDRLAGPHPAARRRDRGSHKQRRSQQHP